MIYIGIDPGASGGVAILEEQAGAWLGARGVLAYRMPASDKELLELLEPLPKSAATFAALEHVWSTPGQGGAFKFGISVGLCRMALTAARIPFDPVLPRTWQKALGVVYAKGLTDTQKKNITKRRAEQLFPGLTITHATADALLLAEFARRYHAGMIRPKARADGSTRRTTEAGAGEAPQGSERRDTEGGRDARAQGEARRPFDGWVPKGRTRRHGPQADPARGPAAPGARGPQGSDALAARVRRRG